ncbi:MAG: hypothetical protein HOP11_09940 [Saprospiraceae bacterium]|nr:hypothetical protein [Saprospiraceae bacterium]
MFPFIESMSYIKGKILHIDFHQDRINRTFKKYYPYTKPLLLHSLHLTDNSGFIQKLRLEYNQHNFKWSLNPYQPTLFKNFIIIETEHLNYSYKYSDRLFFQHIRNLFPKETGILLSCHNQISDELNSNICFKKSDNWHTTEHFLLNGTQRNYLLSNNKINIVNIGIYDIHNYSTFKLINALNPLDTATEYSTQLISKMIKYDKL